MAKKDMLIIHCSATHEGQDVTVEQIRNWHINERHWTDIGYNYVIYRDGSLHEGRPLANGGAHTANYNARSIGVCYIGGCEANSTKAKDTRTYQQNNTLYQFVRSQLIHYRDVENTQMTVHGHYEFAAKACPSFNVEEWLRDTGLINEFPWLVNSPNYQQFLHGQRVKRAGTEGVGCSVASSNVGLATDSALKQTRYISPHKSERDELAKFVHAHQNIIYAFQNNKLNERTLLADPFYYLQNGYIYNQQDDINTDAVTKRQCVKCLLFLHSIPFSYDNVLERGFFNNKNAKHGGVELVPRGYVLLLGGLIWRKRWSESHNNTDPVEYGYTTVENGVETYHQLYSKPEYPYDPLFRQDGEYYKLAYAKGSANVYNVQYEKFVNKEMDEYTANMLVDKFLDFVHTYAKYLEGIELKYKVTTQNGSTSQNNGEVTYIGNAPTSTVEYKMDYKKLGGIMQTLTQSGVKNNLKLTFEYLLGTKEIDLGSNNMVSISGFAYNYSMGFIEDNALSLYYVEDKDNTVGGMFLYNVAFSQPVLVQTTGMNQKFTPNDGSIYQANYKSYLDGFCNTLNYYIKQDPEVSGRISKIEEETSSNEYDFKCEIYALLKNLWDRWFCGFYNSKNASDNAFFTVGNFFNNFLFIDTFYNNIAGQLRLNCRLLLEQYEGNVLDDRKSGHNVVTHLGNIASHHRCAMFNFPDFANFCSDDEGEMWRSLRNMFVPIPSNQVGEPQIMNKFVVVYTHSAKSLSTEDRNRFVPDTFDIWSYDEGTKVAPSIFNYNPNANVGKKKRFRNDSRMGFKVPAFGVAYSRQDNALWKNIRVGMDTHQVTEQSARALAQIAELGNSSKKKLVFYGQDIYSIYQAYSYIVTIEMMGNMQIQPLMYFQLMNVPMFRGTYMIIKVEHNISVGNMTTTFTGMKMSKVQKPFATSWFATINKESDGTNQTVNSDQDTARNGETIRTTDGNELDIMDNKLSEVINSYIGQPMLCDVFVREVYKKAFNVDINHNLAYENGTNMFTELDSSGKWNMIMFKKRPRKSNNWASLSATSTHPKVGDILFGYHNGNIEGKHMHVAIYLGMHDGHHYVAEGGDNEADKSTTCTVPNNKVQVTMIETSMMGEGTDVYTHHAMCTAVKIEQVEHKTETTTNTLAITSDVPASGAITPPSNQTNDLFVQEITSPLHLKIKSFNQPQFPGANSEYKAVTQAAQSQNLGNSQFEPKGMFVTEGSIGQLFKYSGGGGFIYNNDGSFCFYNNNLSYINDIKHTCSGLPTELTINPGQYQSDRITCAFQGYMLIENGRECKTPKVFTNMAEQHHCRALAELKNGKLALIVCDNAMRLVDLQTKMLELNVKNAIYLSSSGNWEYGWCKVPAGTTVNGSNKKIKSNTYYWKLGKPQSNFTWSNVLCF